MLGTGRGCSTHQRDEGENHRLVLLHNVPHNPVFRGTALITLADIRYFDPIQTSGEDQREPKE